MNKEQEENTHIRQLCHTDNFEMAMYIDHGRDGNVIDNLRNEYFDIVWLMELPLERVLSTDFDRSLVSEKWIIRDVIPLLKGLVNQPTEKTITVSHIYQALYKNTWIHKSCNIDETIKYLKGEPTNIEDFHYKYINIDQSKVTSLLLKIDSNWNSVYMHILGQMGELMPHVKLAMEGIGFVLYKGETLNKY